MCSALPMIILQCLYWLCCAALSVVIAWGVLMVKERLARRRSQSRKANLVRFESRYVHYIVSKEDRDAYARSDSSLPPR